VAELKDVSKSYGPTHVFSDVNLTVEKGDRIALVGVNGAGKSTLIRLLAGQDQPSSGKFTLGSNVDSDHFAQDQYKELDPETIIFDEIGRMAPGMNDSEVRTLLGCFLFSGDAVFKRVKVLSGGERNRFALARMLLQPSNFLLMDEPTNHLDIRAKDVLLRAMLAYTGTLVFVSHDRYFIDRLATKVCAIGAGKVDVYPGNYEDYLWSLERRAGGGDSAPGGPSKELLAAVGAAKAHDNGSSAKPKAAEPPRALKKKPGKRINPIFADKLKHQVSALEKEIALLESESAKLNEQLAGHFDDYSKQSETLAEIDKRRIRIEECEREWEQLSVELEAKS
jgi:ATP-binding cassette subfamily F protein 3